MKTQELVREDVHTMPKVEDMKDGVLYVSEHFETAIHLCACGCRGQVVTPFKHFPNDTGWMLSDGPTLSPSIGNQHWSCKSHYFVTNGKIVNC